MRSRCFCPLQPCRKRLIANRWDRLENGYSPPLAVVRRDLPMTHPLFSSMGELKSVTFLGRGDMDDDVYDLVFAKGRGDNVGRARHAR